MNTEEMGMEPTMDPNNLYREEVITDRQMGTIRCLTPINSDGSSDSSRSVIYSGQIQIMTPAGSLPIGTLWECLLLWGFANGHATMITFADNPVWFVGLLLIMASIAGFTAEGVGSSGSADLSPSNKSDLTFDGAGFMSCENRGGRTIHFGVREHAIHINIA